MTTAALKKTMSRPVRLSRTGISPKAGPTFSPAWRLWEGEGGYREDAGRARLEAGGDRPTAWDQPDHPLAPAQGIRTASRRPEQMVASLLALLLLAPTSASPDTNSPFANAITRELI